METFQGPHTQEATGSSPVTPTIRIKRIRRSRLTARLSGRRSAVLRTMKSEGYVANRIRSASAASAKWHILWSDEGQMRLAK